MVAMRPLLAAALLVPLSFCRTASAVENDLPLEHYLVRMGEKLNCYFTLEDIRDPDGFFPWIAYRKDFVPDPEVATIDALVAKLDQELQGVSVVRSAKHPTVVHVIAEDLLQPDYVMDDLVTVEYEGMLWLLPNHLGTLRAGIGTRTFGVTGELQDRTTEAAVDVQNELVRDVLTGAVPLEGYRRLLWEARRIEVDGSPKMLVRYFGRPLTLEEQIGSVEEYLREMGKRLNCYFTIEDRPDPEPEDEDFPWMKDRLDFVTDFEIATIEALAEHLDEELEGVKVVRSTKYPSVIHLMAEDLLQPGYVMERKVSLEFEHELAFVPDELAMLLEGEIRTPHDAPPGVFPGLGGVDTPWVAFAFEDETLRNVLTGAVPLEGHERILWMSIRLEVDGTPHVYVGYSGTSEGEGDE